MDAVQEIRDAFSASYRHLELLHGYLKAQLGAYCETQRYVLKDRIKTLSSTAAKLQQGRYESWSDLDALVGFTVVVPTRGHEKLVEKWLNAKFEHHLTRDRATTEKPPDTFRFDAMRWYGRVEESSILLPEHETLRRFLFEVQIKTVFEDAWSVVTHDVVYKGDDPSWGRARLASQLKAAVEQIDEQVENFESAAAQLPSSPHRRTDLIVQGLATLRQLVEDDLIEPELVPASWTSLMNNLWSFARRQRIPNSDGYRRPERAFPALIEEFERAVRSEEVKPLLSATLFDGIIASAIRSGRASADDFFLVRSEIVAATFGIDFTNEIDLGPAFEAEEE